MGGRERRANKECLSETSAMFQAVVVVLHLHPVKLTCPCTACASSLTNRTSSEWVGEDSQGPMSEASLKMRRTGATHTTPLKAEASIDDAEDDHDAGDDDNEAGDGDDDDDDDDDDDEDDEDDDDDDDEEEEEEEAEEEDEKYEKADALRKID